MATAEHDRRVGEGIMMMLQGFTLIKGVPGGGELSRSPLIEFLPSPRNFLLKDPVLKFLKIEFLNLSVYPAKLTKNYSPCIANALQVY